MTAIIYQNPACDVTLIDIPKSIAGAQGRSDDIEIISCPPLEEPYEIRNEPKKPKAREKHAAYSETQVHTEYKAAIELAMSSIRCNLHPGGSWCLPRKLMTQAPNCGKTEKEVAEKDIEARLREWSTSKGDDDDAFNFEKMMASLGAASEANATSIETATHAWLVSYGPAVGSTTEAHGDESVSSKDPWMSYFYNSQNRAADLTVSANPSHSEGAPHEYSFKIPPRASFFLSDSTEPGSFRASFRELTEEYVLPRHFDFVLLDPPWPSGSAKRKVAYEQIGGMPYMRKLLSKLDLDNYLEHNAIVGVWITNKQAARDLVLGPGGLFENWNVGLIEEWIWVKTTSKGEPMFSMDSIWRKPYETLLLGRAAPNSWTTMASAPEIKRRVIAAVPDIHSRKPCLKELIEPHLPPDYSALEIFARYLVAGWTSWGNEAIKFNWDKYWTTKREDDGAPPPPSPPHELQS
ncbi:MT-A70-domain-containing protein [Aaosphaeria arxii CBS 175.79]|uniref:MT-A70-domain-containing protein n=1 Tax=Aaosphaeria arxii CBS 175.79 TaxID=1450172 RepID=A0A6A5Y0F6_9PLEO|nr:MT-A70-domain-containing protein [Aaosphaeria arxii CBS 175.79]KAF2018932.1 MT-A70-domain-containing protein [Aaosphaeria arxii CBS 175.79]